MHVASLELCRTLHELSGWGDTDWHYVKLVGKHTKLMRQPANTLAVQRRVPAYDLGYLMRKLQNDQLRLVHGSVDWQAELVRAGQKTTWAHDATPEDAAAKLAIELFMQGILATG